MSETKPGADELRMRGILRRRGVGYDAEPDAVTRPSDARERDWLDDILDSDEAKQAPRKAAKTEPDEPVDETDEGTEDDPDGPPPRWDPVAIADRITHAYQQRSAGERLRHAVDVVAQSKAQFGQLAYTATGVWAAWRIGFTPWLLHFTADAPIGIPILALGLGWLVHRRLDPGPTLIAWTGRAIYTATAINLVLHP